MLKTFKILCTALLLLLLAVPAFAQSPKQEKPVTKQKTATKKPTTKKPATKKKVAKKKTVRKKQQQELVVVNPSSICGDSLVTFAKKFLGTHYKYANCSPETGFDCTGFVYYVYGQFGVKVPRSSIDYGSLEPIVSKDSASIGDVIVFTGTNAANRNPGHVGIVISKPGEELTFIHSSSNKKRGGVIISTYKSSPYYEKRFIKIVRIKTATIEVCTK